MASTAAAAPPTTTATFNPGGPNGANGWYRTVPTITLSDGNNSRIYYRWDAPGSFPTVPPWTRQDTTPFPAIQGPHMLWIGGTNPNHNNSANWENPHSYAVSVDTAAPTAATLTPTVLGTSSVRLAWTSSTDPNGANGSGLAGFDVYQNGALVATTASGTTSYQVTGLSAATTYSFSVRARDVAGNTTESNTVSATTAPPPDTTPPSAPTGLATGTITTTSIALSWTAPPEPDVASYEIYIVGNPTPVGSTSGTTHNVGGLSAGTTYQFEVVALDTSGNPSSPSTTIDATTQSSGGGTGPPVYGAPASSVWSLGLLTLFGVGIMGVSLRDRARHGR